MKKFIAVQLGARRAYAVPSILEKAGMLETFYTDLCGNVGVLGSLLNYLPQSLIKGQLKNLYGRQLPDNIIHKTVTFPYLTLQYEFEKKLSQCEEDKLRAFVKLANKIGDTITNKGLGEATHLFTMFGEGMPLVRFAKQSGLTTITETFILWSAHNIIEQERQLFSDLEQPLDSYYSKEAQESGKQWQQELLKLSDWTIAPSEAVRRDQEINFGFCSNRCFVVPYAVDDSWFQIKNNPIPKRILFVGTADLRKGIHYLGMAAETLKSRGYEFRVAGGVSEQIRQHSITKSLTFLGRVPRSQIKQEYSSASIFVLPSLAEGSAEATYEALASGLPVITTVASGSVVRDNIEGFIVPERDPTVLAERIEELVENRQLRDRMALAAKDRAKDYTWGKYAKRLLTVFETI